MKNLAERINQLPEELRKEVEDFVSFLVEKRGKKVGKKLAQTWGGGLSEYKNKYTSLELQKKALEWRGD